MKKLVSIIVATFACLFFGAPEASAQITSDTYNDGLYVENATGMKKIIPNPEIREADILWKKRVWREIDFRQKMNLPFYYPRDSHQNWRRFIDVIMDALKEGRCQAYEVTVTGELNNPMPYSKLMTGLNSEKHQAIYDDYGNKVGDTVISIAFKPESVTRLRVMEDWYFDAHRSQMMVRIEAICPVTMRDINDSVQMPNELFWIPFDEATRTVLSEAPVYNRNNSAARLSYDDIFMKRQFDSYIYKEENVYDRSIQDYATGIEALKESERIKQEIIEFEQNMWEY
ncbi:MAG: gliding motility protein GldN [Bacteroidales bacterium]|nr:gliding motility protein GldN [Bacteroidales bacterium]